MRRWMESIGTWGVLSVILLIGAVLRFQSLDWDEGQHQHPDERFMTMVATAIEMPSSLADYFHTETSSANPYLRGFNSYAYGTAPLFLARLVAERSGDTDYQHIYLIGRGMSAVLDLLTVLLLFLVGRIFLPRGFALLAAGFYALTVLAIQQAHFFTVDSAGTLMVTVCLYGCARMIAGGRLHYAVWAGLALGLGIACRVNLLLFAPLVAATFFVRLKREGEHAERGIARAVVGLALAAFFTALAFRVAQPTAFEGWWRLSPRWIEDVGRVIQISQGRVEVPYTQQWAGRMRWVFPWMNMVRWGMGWGLGLSAWLGVATALGIGAFVFHRRLDWNVGCCLPAFLAGWVLWPFFWHGREYLMTMRYFLPVYPALILLAAWWLMRASDWIRKTAPAGFHWTCHAPWMVILVMTGLWATAFSSIYHRPNTRIAASRWMFQAFPSGSAVACEHWDDELPLACQKPGEKTPHLRSISLPLYEADTPEKLERLRGLLDRTDFVVLSSDRLVGSIPRLPTRYPMTTRYYEALLDGSLGFEQVAEFVSHPTIGTRVFDNSSAEEAFSVYDHPRVRIFSKTPSWQPEKARKILSDGVDWAHVDTRPARLIAQGAASTALTEAQRQVVRAGGTWSSRLDAAKGLFNRASFANRFPLLVWVLMLECSAWMFFPVAFRLFRGFPDRGWLAARLVAPVLMTYPVWLAARCGLFYATPGAVRGLFAAGLLAAATAYAVSRPLRSALRAKWRIMLIESLLYWGVFAVFLLLRFSNPDLWHPYFGGEKPMDFAFLNAVLRSPFYPPYNPWCAGEYINYYYMGFVQCSVWIKITGVIPSVAYNLIIPTLAANTAVAAFCGGGLLLNGLAGQKGEGSGGVRFSRAVYWTGGLAALFLAVFSGNLYEWTLLLREQVPDWDWFWAASRAILTPEGEIPPITEFPFFTFLYGDLHAHMLDMPLFLFNALLAIALLRGAGSRGWLSALAALNLGMMYTVNAWDFPAGLLLLVWAFFFTLHDTPARRFFYTALYGVGMACSAILLFLPFHLDLQSAYSSFQWWEGPRTGAVDFALIFGVLLLPPALLFIRWAVHPRRSGMDVLRHPMFPLWIGFFLLAAGMVAGVEFLVLEGDIGRMNTVFKFYLQAWLLLAVFAGACAGVFRRRDVWESRSGQVVLVLCLLAGLASLFYAWRAVPARARCRFEGHERLTLDGQAFMEYAVYHRDHHAYALKDDYDAIRYLQEEVSGTPVLVEAQLPEYSWGGRYSIHTGLPTILGWSWHQRQQHAGQPDWIIPARARDVAEIYNTPSLPRALELMQKYDAEYLVVGPAERAAYAANGLAKFEQTNAHWTVWYRNPGVTIYHGRDGVPSRPETTAGTLW